MRGSSDSGSGPAAARPDWQRRILADSQASFWKLV
jgi:hypothetical protein